jgi:predicted enzyme related to lactoylglutathione lyase
MKRAIGIGGIFFKSENPKELAAWYQKHLGINIESWGGAVIKWPEMAKENPGAYTVWNAFKADTDYFSPSTNEFMVNFVVADLDALLPALQAEGVELIGEPMNDANFSKFTWIMDLEGRKVELWEPPKDKIK